VVEPPKKGVTPPAQNVSQSSPWSCQACSVEDQQPASYGPRWARQILVIITAKWPSGELARGKDWGVDPPPHAARVLLASHALSKAEVEDETCLPREREPTSRVLMELLQIGSLPRGLA
jgi:hypothetical protein